MRLSVQSILIPFFSIILSPAIAGLLPCDAAKRIELAQIAVGNMFLPTAAQSTAAYSIFPFTNDVTISLKINQVIPVQASYIRITTLAFLAALYQLVHKATGTTATNIDDTKTLFTTRVQLGIAHSTVPLPVYAEFAGVLTFVLETCQLKTVVADATVPA